MPEATLRDKCIFNEKTSFGLGPQLTVIGAKGLKFTQKGNG